MWRPAGSEALNVTRKRSGWHSPSETSFGCFEQDRRETSASHECLETPWGTEEPHVRHFVLAPDARLSTSLLRTSLLVVGVACAGRFGPLSDLRWWAPGVIPRSPQGWPMMIRRITIVAAFLLLLSPAAAAGQAQLGLGLGYGSYSGDDFEGQEAGLTFWGNVLFGVSDRFQLGGEFDYSSYGIEGFEESVGQIDIAALARYTFPGEAARFYTGGRVSFSRQSVDVLDVSGSSNGFGIGPTLGVLIPVGTLSIDLGGDLLFQSFGDADVDGITVDGTDQSGFRFIVRGGLAIPLGSQ